MNRTNVWCLLLGIMLLSSVQFTGAQTDFSNEDDESTENLTSSENSNENQNGANTDNVKLELNNFLGRQLTDAADERRTQRPVQKNPPRFESEETESDEYDPYRDNFFDRHEDGTYVYGYSLPHGVRRYERSFFSDKYKGLVVEGFYTQKRQFGQRSMYELRCYHSDAYSGYRPLPVQYLSRPPVVVRDEEPDVNCFDS